MRKQQVITYLSAFSLVVGTVILSGNAIVVADDKKPSHYLKKEEKRQTRDKEQSRNEHREREKHERHDRDKYSHSRPRVIHHGPTYVLPPKRVRRYRDIEIIRPYGHWYSGYGHIHVDNDAFAWLAFTAITLKVLDNLNEQQQREHEAAQVRATTAPIGEKIIWRDGNTYGSVTATREGTTTTGRYCREFLQEIVVGGKKEQAYGTACRQPDGAWEVISTGVPGE